MRLLLGTLLVGCGDHDGGPIGPTGGGDDDDSWTGTLPTDTGGGDDGPAPDLSTIGSAEFCIVLFGGLDRVRGPDEGLPLGDIGRTLQAWVRTDNTGEQIAISYGRPSPGQGIQLGTTSGFPMLRVGSSSTGVITGDLFVGDDEWHHLAASWDGRTAVLLVDGAIAGTGALEGATLEGDVVAGNTPTGDLSKPWVGWLDDVKIIFGPRSPDDVAADPEGATVPPDDLLLWWDFEVPEEIQGLGIEVPDLSGQGHDGVTAGLDGTPMFVPCR
jgi:hypothetical protein